jgi:hypothetical protein
MDTLTTGLKAKTLPLRWWKLVMTCKALTAPVIGVIAWWIIMERYTTAPINLGNRVDQITIIVICVINAVFAGTSACVWLIRYEHRFLWTLSILLSTFTGAMASGVVFELTHSYTYVY